MKTVLTSIRKELARKRRKIAKTLAPKPVQHIDDKPVSKEEKEFGSRVVDAVADKFGTTKKDVHVVIVPDLGNMLINGARDYLFEVDPKLLKRVDDSKK